MSPVTKGFFIECISGFMGLSILALMCGDIVTEEVEIEKKICKWPQIEHKWGTVKLIYEADVFL